MKIKMFVATLVALAFLGTTVFAQTTQTDLTKLKAEKEKLSNPKAPTPTNHSAANVTKIDKKTAKATNSAVKTSKKATKDAVKTNSSVKGATKKGVKKNVSTDKAPTVK
jgi:hypothetical protein